MTTDPNSTLFGFSVAVIVLTVVIIFFMLVLVRKYSESNAKSVYAVPMTITGISLFLLASGIVGAIAARERPVSDAMKTTLKAVGGVGIASSLVAVIVSAVGLWAKNSDVFIEPK